jgi:hypothetical protein
MQKVRAVPVSLRLKVHIILRSRQPDPVIRTRHAGTELEGRESYPHDLLHECVGQSGTFTGEAPGEGLVYWSPIQWPPEETLGDDGAALASVWLHRKDGPA